MTTILKKKKRNEREKIRTNSAEIQKIIRKCYGQLYANKMDKLQEMDKFLETYSLPKLNHEETGRASLMAQWLGICLPMQGTRVRALVWEDPTCHGATRPVSHNC